MTEKERQVHSKDAYLYCISRMLERTSYYGILTILILYLVDGGIKMEPSEATEIYAIFISGFLLSKVLGAIIGDLLIGNKQSIILGSTLQALGMFSLCLTSTTGIYIGLSLIVIGGGLYSPNIISNFGKLYLKKPKLLDAGYLMLYLAFLLGTVLGLILLGYLSDEYGWSISFVFSGFLMVLSIIPLLLLKEKSPRRMMNNELKIKTRVVNVAVAFLFIGLFWLFFEISNFGAENLVIEFKMNSSIAISSNLWSILDSASYVPFALVAVILWTYFYSSQFYKLLIAIIFGALSFAILLFIPENPESVHLILYILSIMLLRISEVHITPLVHSILAKYSNPKYLAIFISLAFIPTRIFFILYLAVFHNGFLDIEPSFYILLGMSGMIVLMFAVFLYCRINKINYLQ